MKVRGFQVAPAELEGCILDHPDVADTCVVGVPDDYSMSTILSYMDQHYYRWRTAYGVYCSLSKRDSED